MNELRAILDGIDELWRLGERPALATVVRVRGSAYRRPGARMLVGVGGGRRVGSVSGGCLEGDVARRAMELTAGGGAAVLRYDSTADDDGLWGLGLGCSGVVEVLVERLDAGNPLPGFLRGCLARRERGVVASVFGAAAGAVGVPVGARLLVDAGGRVSFDPAGLAERVGRLVTDARRCLSDGRTRTAVYGPGTGTEVDVLLEVVEPPTALVIFGAGWDAGPMVAAGKALGWDVTVVDRRAGHATAARFPAADAVIVCPPDAAGRGVRFDARTAAVIMTHHYPDDLGYLGAALRSEAAYVGLLGPARRRERLLADLADRDGFVPTPAQLARLHGPVGLDIGADDPAEVAASVVAEIVAAARGRGGGALRHRGAGIHDVVPEIGRAPD